MAFAVGRCLTAEFPAADFHLGRQRRVRGLASILSVRLPLPLVCPIGSIQVNKFSD